MHFHLTTKQRDLRDEFRAYFDQLMTSELRTELEKTTGEGGGPLYQQAMKKMGTDGYIALSWPEKFGGRGLSALEQYMFIEEVMRAGFPFPFLTTESVGPMLRDNASERIQKEVVPGIVAGTVNIAIGYSEPSAGTDLASLQTKAERDGDDWIINGQKMWTSLCHMADYVWLAARTDPDAPKHKGISMFLLPTNAEGFSLSPVHTLGGVRTNATYYDNVRVPGDALVGELNKGWKLITSQLNRERLALVNVGFFSEKYNTLVKWAQESQLADGRKVIDLAWVRTHLARIRTGLEALRLICYKLAWQMDSNELNMADASAAKVYGTELFVEIYRLAGEIIGQHSILRRDSEDANLGGNIENLYRTASIITFGGGANEVQRDIIAAAGLWMPIGSRMG
jgi:alkylation response protein AidB-like acyl-CoA dehydrogenase